MARTPIQFAAAATGTFTVSDYQYLAGLDSTTTITITNYAVMTGGNFNFGGGFIILTEGVDFNAVTSNNVTAGNVATAINTAAGGTIAVAVGAVITVTLPGENDGLTIIWTGGAGVSPTTATLSGGFDVTQIRLGSVPIIGVFGDDIAIGASNAACATNIAAYINGIGQPVTAVATNNVVTLTYTSVGTAGNSYAIVAQAANGGIASGGCTASGATLTGGVAGTTARTQVTRTATPKDLLVAAGTAKGDFTTTAGWTLAGSGAALAVDSTSGHFNANYASAGLKLSSTNAVAATMTLTISESYYDAQTISFDVYIDDITKMSSSGCLYLSDDSGFTNYNSWTLNTGRFFNGLNHVVIDRSEFATTGTGSFSNTKVRLRFRVVATASNTVNLTFSNLKVNELHKPVVSFCFDDIFQEAYDNGYSYINPLGLRGNINVVSDYIDGSGRWTTAELNTAYAAGWDISNHTKTHADLTTLSSAQQQVELQTCENILVANGWTRSPKYLAYPGGFYNQTTLDLMTSLSYVWGRTTTVDTNLRTTSEPFNNPYQIKVNYILNTTTLATAKIGFDMALKHGQAVIFVFHKIVTTPTVSTEWSIADFQALVAYILPYVNSGEVLNLTGPELYKRMTDARFNNVSPTRTQI